MGTQKKLILTCLLVITIFIPSVTDTLSSHVWGQTESDVEIIINKLSEPLTLSNEAENHTHIAFDLEYINGISEYALDNGWHVAIFFHADWCYFCQEMRPVVDEAEMIFRERMVFLRVDEANNSDLVEAYNITGFPTLVIMSPEKNENVVISGYKEPTALIREINYALGESESMPASWEACSDPIGGLFNHYSCSFADCLDECTDLKDVDWGSIVTEALETALSCSPADLVSNIYSCGKAGITHDPSDAASCFASLASAPGMPVGCAYSVGHLLADMMGAQQLGECLGQCAADSSSYGQLCQPGGQQLSCKSNSFIGVDECVDCEWRYVDNSVTACGAGESCVTTGNGAECRDPDEDDDDPDDPDRPPKRPPRVPALDHPDDNFDVSTEWLESQFTWNSEGGSTGNVAILDRGYPSVDNGLVDFYQSIYGGEYPQLVDINSVTSLSSSEYPVLILPSGSLYGLAGVSSVKEDFERYVGNGGSIVMFSQFSGAEFELLPGGEVTGYGWSEEESCMIRSATITTYHPILSGIDSSYVREGHELDLGIDGFFLTVPDGTTEILTRKKNFSPALIHYTYGAGEVIATTSYMDLGPNSGIWNGNQMVSRLILRNMIEWGRSDKPVPTVTPELIDPVELIINFTNPLINSKSWSHFARGDTVEIEYTVFNNHASNADQVTFTVIDPYYITYTVDVPQTVAADTSETVTLQLETNPDSPPGIWMVIYDLYEGEEWRWNGYSGAFTLDIDLSELTSFIMYYNVTDPNGDSVTSGEKGFSLDPGLTAKIPVSVAATPASGQGLWRIDYRIKTESGLVVKQDVQMTAVTDINYLPLGFSYSPDIRASVTSDAEYYPFMADAEFTVHVWNDGDEAKEVYIAMAFPHHYWYTDGDPIYGQGATWVLMSSHLRVDTTVEAHGYYSYTFTVPVFCEVDKLWVNVWGEGQYIDSYDLLVMQARRGFFSVTEFGELDVGEPYLEGTDLVFPVNIVGGPISGVQRVSLQMLDYDYFPNIIWPDDIVWEHEYDVEIGANERYEGTIHVPVSAFGESGVYSYFLRVNWLTDNWSYEWDYVKSLLIVPSQKVTLTFNQTRYHEDDSGYIDITYHNPLSTTFVDDIEFTIDGLSFSHTETVTVPPEDSYTSHVQFDIPEGVSSGVYTGDLNGMYTSTFTVPQSDLEISLPDSLETDTPKTVTITNQGWVRATCGYELTLVDDKNNMILSMSGSKEIKHGRSLKLNFSLPDQLKYGQYSLNVESNDYESHRIKDRHRRYSLEGLSAELEVTTDQSVYPTGGEIQFTADVTNFYGEIQDGVLELRLSATEPQSPLTCIVPTDDMVITEDTILCPGTYTIPDAGSQGIIIIGANDVVFDGNGAVINGGGTGYAVRDRGYTGVTVKGLTVKDYTYGVYLTGSRNTVYDVEVEGAERGVHIGSSSHHNKVLDSVFKDCRRGIYSYSDNDIIQGNSFDPATLTGVWLNGARDTILFDNLFNGNSKGIQYIGSSYSMPGNITVRKNTFLANSYAIYFEDGSQGNTFTENIFQQTSSGFWLENSDGNTISHNLIEDASCGIQVYTGSDENIIANNRIERCDYGIYLYYWWGVLGEEGPPANQDNKIVSNFVTDSINGGILIERDNNGTLVANNTVTESGASCIMLKGRVTNSIIVNNTFSDGFKAYNFLATGTIYPTDNLFYRNVDQGNSYKSQGTTSSFPNMWNTNSEGNYWNDYLGTDGDGDGIGDTAYSYSYITDEYPYVEKYTWSRYDLSTVYSQMTVLDWDTLNWVIPDAEVGSEASEGTLMWETSTPLDLIDTFTQSYNPTSIDNLGKYIIIGQIYSSQDQLIEQGSTTFYVTDSDVYLQTAKDKTIYQPGETIEITITLINQGASSGDYDLKLWVNGTQIHGSTETLNPGEPVNIIVTTSSDKSIELTSTVNGFEVTETILVKPLMVEATLSAPAIAGVQPFMINLELVNVGQIDADMHVTMLDLDTDLTLEAGSTTLLQTSTSITADMTVTATITGDHTETLQQPVVFGESAVATLTVETYYLEGVVPIYYSVENTGIIDSTFDLLFHINGGTVIEPIHVPVAQVVEGRVDLSLISGLYTLDVETPFETITETLNVQGKPDYVIIDYPLELTFNAGDIAVIPYTITNTGGSGGLAVVTMDVPGMVEDIQTVMLDPGEVESLSFILPILDDIGSMEQQVILSVDGKTYTVTLTLIGAEIQVDAELDKNLYVAGEDAVLTINVQNLNEMDLELFSIVALEQHQETQEFSLAGSASTTLTFTVPAGFSEKLTYSVYIDSGRALHINRVYLYEKPDPSASITLYTDKQVYEIDETVTIYVETTASGTLTLKGPGYETEEAITAGSHTYTFTVPKLRTGTYYIEYGFEGYTAAYPIDIIGYSARPGGLTLNQAEYELGDDVELTLIINANTGFEGFVTAWILDPDNDAIAQAMVDHSFIEGENTVVLSLPLDTEQPGLHGFAYKIYAYGSVIWLNSGGGYFDVTDTFPPEIDLQSPLSQSYTSTNVPLTYKLNEPIEWVSYSLDGASNVTLTGNTTLTGLSKTTHTITLFAQDQTGNQGKTTISFSVTSHIIRSPPTIDPLEAVQLMDPMDITTNAMTLQWTPCTSQHFIEYILYMSQSNEETGTPIATIFDIEETSYTVDGIQSNTTYYFTVRVNDDYGQYVDSNQVSSTTDPESEPPIIPVTLPMNVTVTGDEYTVEWTVDGELEYIVMSIDGGVNITLTSGHRLSGLESGVHVLVIYASDIYGNTVTETVFFTVASTVVDSVPPSIIHFPEEKALGSEALTLYAVVRDDNVVQYSRIYYRAGGISAFSWVEMETCDSCVDSYEGAIPVQAMNHETVEYYIAVSDGYNDAYHPVEAPQRLHVIEVDLPPVAVSLLSSSEIGVNHVTLTWTPCVEDDFSNYTLYVSPNGLTIGEAVALLFEQDEATVLVADLSPETTYYFTIRVYDTTGLYADSETYDVTTVSQGGVSLLFIGVTSAVLLSLIYYILSKRMDLGELLKRLSNTDRTLTL